jgi:hypothetical protein
MDLAQANADSAKRAKEHVDETLVSLFQPDALLSNQNLDSFRRHVTFEPERQLMVALLEDAIKTFQDNLSASAGKKRRLFEAAEEWIFGADSDWGFSFASVCRALGMDPN